MLSEQPYDLLVIGGGINGAGIARDAAGRTSADVSWSASAPTQADGGEP